ncbi:SGT1 protein-domain-containing protein [Chaetomium sp. MPI-SDFR-AT-0129]|nr:SGT1 protein-domain-containing protein [Chaetomium sp. MPI-SDFR-AT-0129]
MDSAPEPRPGDSDFDGFRMMVSEDYAEYMLFVIGDKTQDNVPSLETVRKAADQKLSALASDYIWQREPFRLEAKTRKGLGLPYLHGITHYGDNVEDEWLIVYLLRELSKSFPDLWVRVSDSDGEFLLVEAAKVTPNWLSPENDAHRVWIHDGKLVLIPLTSTSEPRLSLAEALDTIRTTPLSALIHSPLVEAEAFYRLEKYPAQITASLHHSPITIPRKLAHILHALPKSIAPATEAFYLRDPRALKPLLSTTSGAPTDLTFPPTDLVTISVRFTRVLYAQLKSQYFTPPPAWAPILRAAEGHDGDDAPSGNGNGNDNPNPNNKLFSRLELGMKLTTGFELLAHTAEQSPSRVAREMALLLEDLAEDGGDSALPTDSEIEKWEDVGREDDDGWMDIDFEDFERELEGKRGVIRHKDGVDTARGKEKSGFGDAAAQADLQKIVARFEAFLNDESAGVEGAEMDEMDRDDDEDDDEDDSGEKGGDSDEDEDKAVSFDEDKFASMMREMMGLPAEEGKKSPDGKGKGSGLAREGPKEEDADEDESGDDEEGEEEIRKLMAQMENELKGLGALSLDPQPKAPGTIKEKGERGSGPKAQAGPEHDEEEIEESGDEEVDIDFNLAKNLLESFKSQAGMAGPAGNILGMMGLSLPRDEEDSEEDESR